MSDPTYVFSGSKSVGMLWSEDERLHFAPVDLEDPAAKHLANLVESSNRMLAPADLAQPVVLDMMRAAYPALYTQTSLVAAASPEAYEYVEKSPYTLTFDDSDVPIGLVWNDQDQISVREDGEWVTPLDDDPRFYGNEFHFVTEEAVELFDRLVQDNLPLTSDAFSEVYV